MGLFRKKGESPEQLEALRAEIKSLRARLDASDLQKADLVHRVESVDQINAALYQRVDTVDQTNAVLYQRVDSLDSTSAALGEQVGAVDAEVGRVKEGVAVIHEQVGSANAQANTVSTLGAQVQSLTERLQATPTPPPPTPPPAPDNRIEQLMEQVAALSASVSEQSETPLVDPGEVRQLAAQLDALTSTLQAQSTRIDQAELRDSELADQTPGVDPDEVGAMRREMAQMAERMSTLDHRMTNVSVELAHQLTELSSDLEVLLEASNEPGTESSDDTAAVSLAIEAVQHSTERLAAEQARYQIAFREDLAELAERLRRPNR